MRNARQSEAASRSTSVLKYEVDVCGHDEYIYTSYLGGSGGKNRLLEVPFCDYVMRGSPRPHPTLLVFSDTKCSHAATVDIFIVGISEAPSRHRPFEGPFGEMRNARRPIAASRSTLVSTHQTHITLQGERVKRGIFGVST